MRRAHTRGLACGLPDRLIAATAAFALRPWSAGRASSRRLPSAVPLGRSEACRNASCFFDRACKDRADLAIFHHQQSADRAARGRGDIIAKSRWMAISSCTIRAAPSAACVTSVNARSRGRPTRTPASPIASMIR